MLFQIKRDESSATFKLVVASVSKNYSSSFDDKSSAMLKLVVASVTNKDSKGPTNDSPAKVPTIATSIRHEVFDYSSSFDDKSSAMLKLVVASVTNKDSKGPTNDSPAKVPTIATSIRHEVFDNYLPCHPIMNVSKTTSISAISTMTAPPNLSYLTPTILLFPFNYDFLKNLTATHANFTRQLIVASKRGVSHAQLIIDNIAHLFSVSEGAQDVDPAAVHEESFKVINGSYAK